MYELNQINQLEQEAIYLASMKASNHEINATITEMMTLTKRYLGETNCYFDDIKTEEKDFFWGKRKD